MPTNVLELLGDPTDLLDTVFRALARQQIDVSTYELDHICYRVADEDDYRQKKADLATMGECISEQQIGGRPISTFRLEQPILYADREISLLELPAPKPGRPYRPGYEHVEFAVGMSLFDFEQLHPQVRFITRGSQKAVNPELRISLGRYSIKFHEHPLDYVIRHLDP